MHADVFEQTDLEVFKVEPAADRVAPLGGVCACALYLDHNEYERNPPILRQANFAPERFQPYQRPAP